MKHSLEWEQTDGRRPMNFENKRKKEKKGRNKIAEMEGFIERKPDIIEGQKTITKLTTK